MLCDKYDYLTPKFLCEHIRVYTDLDALTETYQWYLGISRLPQMSADELYLDLLDQRSDLAPVVKAFSDQFEKLQYS